MPVYIIADSIVTSESEALIDVYRIFGEIIRRVTRGVNELGRDAYDQALRDVPVRKVFKHGHKNVGSKVFAEKLVNGRQETRQLSLEEALSESVLRRRLGLPSAFPTANGRRVRGSVSAINTTDFGTYRTKSRANPTFDNRREVEVKKVQGRNRLVSAEEYKAIDERGREIDLGHRTVLRPDVESELSNRGKYELSRAKAGQSLGGALKRSVEFHQAASQGAKIKASVSAGGGEVDYAKYVEFGTRRSRAQPFLRPALAQAAAHGLEVMSQSLKNEA